MNKQQFNLIAEKLIKSPQQREAVELYTMQGLTAYQAEKRIHGRITNTVLKDAKRIAATYSFYEQLADLAVRPTRNKLKPFTFR